MNYNKAIYYAPQYLLAFPLTVAHPAGGIAKPLLPGRTPWIQGLCGNEATGDMHQAQEDGTGTN